MSRISDIYDALRARLVAIYPSHRELARPSNIQLNDLLTMSKGQGLRILEGNNTNRLIGCKLSIRRSCEVTVTRQIFARELDIAARVQTEKDLFEDQFLLIKDFEKDATLSTVTAKIAYLADNGVEEIFIDQTEYIMTKTIFEFEYLEDLN